MQAKYQRMLRSSRNPRRPVSGSEPNQVEPDELDEPVRDIMTDLQKFINRPRKPVTLQAKRTSRILALADLEPEPKWNLRAPTGLKFKAARPLSVNKLAGAKEVTQLLLELRRQRWGPKPEHQQADNQKDKPTECSRLAVNTTIHESPVHESPIPPPAMDSFAGHVRRVQPRHAAGRIKPKTLTPEQLEARRLRKEERIRVKNRLAGPDAVNQTGELLCVDRVLPWPETFGSAYSISMREQRQAGMMARLGPWAQHVQHWPATDGSLLDRKQWVRNRTVSPFSKMIRGQIGCYDSHVRLWQHQVDQHIPLMLILEDDANIRHSLKFSQSWTRVMEEIEQHGLTWDMLYLGRGQEKHAGKVTRRVAKARGLSGLFAYALTWQGASRLLARCRPYLDPVDVYVARMHDAGAVKALTAYPSLCYVVPVHSDTGHIA